LLSSFAQEEMLAAPFAESLAAWETPWMLRETSAAPEEALWTFSESTFVDEVTLWSERTISEVVADCSSTAAAMLLAIWLTCSMTEATSSMATIEFAVFS